MSTNARSRGQARGQPPNQSSRGAPTRGRAIPQYDGPASRGSATSHGGSATGSAAGTQTQVSGPPPSAPSQAGSAAPTPIARDPAREGPAPRATDAIKNVDMPASFYNIDAQYGLETKFVKRPSFNPTGQAIALPVNSYEVTKIPNLTIYQYDVTIGNGAEKRIVQEKVWQSQERKNAIGTDVIYDGNKLAWSLNRVGKSATDNNARFIADLDRAEGRTNSNGKNSFRVTVNQSKVLNIASLDAFLQGRIQYHSDVLEAINFLDHLMRETPSRDSRLVQVKRSFFRRQGERQDLGSAVEVFRGVYQSIRPAQGGRMVVNLDVANTTFWRPQALINTMLQKEGFRDVGQLAQRLGNDASRRAINKWLKKLSVTVKYPGNKAPNKVWKIEKINDATANSHRIQWRDPQTGQETGESVSVTAYFKRRYNINLQQPNLPLIMMSRKIKGNPVYFPAELCHLVENQRYAAKLDESQTANMIKFAVSPPNVRLASINAGKSWLEWDRDPLFKQYGLAINPQQIVTQARILPNPMVKFKNKTENPAYKGRWDLRAKQFLTPNSEELISWGIGVFTTGRVKLGKGELDKFAMDFSRAYRGHGGRVGAKPPHVMALNADAGTAVNDLYQATGNNFQLKPQMLIFIVQNKDSQHYLRIKKSCDARFGVVSQVLQAQQVQKGNPQYYSNVLMKFNAKLGGSTAQAVPQKNSGWSGTFSTPTVFIGADVSHASPGSEQPSMAAMTVSYDKIGARYAAGCQTNGYRVEMIQEQTIRNILGPILSNWMSTIGGGRVPQQIYYLRDGVSEGQFIQVVQEELPAIRGVMDKLAGGKWGGKITVIIAAKRHHIRAFPKANDGDQKGNPVPGTLIERDVTSVQEFDFYLYSHIALQGTSRPVHYTVLVDEANHSPAALQNMIYEHCYQYMRSTTSVSLHPAVYYAHLASNRAKAHENVPATAGPQGGPGFKQNMSSSSDTPRSSDAPKLLDLSKAGNPAIRYSMWYI